MSDIALIWNAGIGGADISTDGADLATDDGLETALLISIFTDRIASESETLSAGGQSRRGWWGDMAAIPGDSIGSRLWLLEREKTQQNVVQRANEYLREAVQWIIDDKLATRIETLAEHTRFQELDLQVSVYKPNGNIIKFRYAYEWKAQAGKVTE